VFPLYDENPHFLTPVVTWGIIVANAVVWMAVQGMGSDPALTRSVCELGLVPGELLQRIAPGTQIPIGEGVSCVTTARAGWHTLVTSMFLHGGWAHLGGNMLYLWIFGDNLEKAMGHARFTAFYLVCGLAAGLAHVVFNSTSGVPTVGASGAISGILGGYLMLFPQNRVRVLTRSGVTAVPAAYMLGFWILIQLLSGLGSIADTPQGGGVAYLAHIGGFVAGLVLVKLFASGASVRPALA
jgi:membrane associated rhomboid family serine protease